MKWKWVEGNTGHLEQLIKTAGKIVNDNLTKPDTYLLKQALLQKILSVH